MESVSGVSQNIPDHSNDSNEKVELSADKAKESEVPSEGQEVQDDPQDGLSSSLSARYRTLLAEVIKEESDLTFSKTLKLLEDVDPQELTAKKAELKEIFNQVLEAMVQLPPPDVENSESEDTGSVVSFMM